MAKLRNVSPIGALDIPALGRIIAGGETFDVPDELLASFTEQTANYALVPEDGTESEQAPDAEPAPEQETTPEGASE
ncbi:hypothetical protein QN355_06310 [Cryobacterium sp. 10S3]|uniref:hypothetical protein n=1 Tax=Cryobacterium sp. 10S3 TaxID=3048582 RepID=UPI002AC9DD99|nr:hypothetical protein [Cryobacterium sp. 10S3]MEB0286161.1 hypothetical protein [Cryobacterium sp. 10S3]WPX12219.1 hypothetical protein RHM57_11050 [Cryobacterium sp. 10S3]